MPRKSSKFSSLKKSSRNSRQTVVDIHQYIKQEKEEIIVDVVEWTEENEVFKSNKEELKLEEPKQEELQEEELQINDTVKFSPKTKEIVAEIETLTQNDDSQSTISSSAKDEDSQDAQKGPKKSKQTCEKCGKVFIIVKSFKRHKCDYNCKFCGRKFNVQKRVAEHMKKFHMAELGNSLSKCKICGSLFILKWSLEAHMKTKHSDGKIHNFVCDFDGKIFKNKQDLYRHMKTHMPTVKCEICNAELKPRSINQHLKEVHVVKREFQCDICQKYFKSHSALKMHKKNHNKRFKCELCNKKFSLPSLLNQHQKEVHENPNSFSCQVCDKKFNYKTNLLSHMKTHEKDRAKPFKCPRCDYATDSQERFSKHTKYHLKLDEKYALIKNPLKCTKCPTMCKDKRALRNHIRRVHPSNLLKCDYCGKDFKAKAHLIRHIRGLHLRSVK